MPLTDPAPGSGRVVIIGAGHAGGSAAAFLKQYGFEGEIILIGEEDIAPYQRPPLSKAWLKGEADHDSLLLKSSSWYKENGITLKTGLSVTGIDRKNRMVSLNDGQGMAYDHLILATGARARALSVPGADSPRLHSLRTTRDAARLQAALRPGSHLAIVGGGYVGLEVAASARALGVRVSLVEREARLLARVASPVLANHFHDRHKAEGVAILTSAQVSAIENTDNGHGLILNDGYRLDCDQVLIGVGAVPNDDLARSCGLDCQDGVMVDRQARTSDGAIFAIGDVSHRPLDHPVTTARLESVPNALEQARQVASAITGRPLPPQEVPWFWSDQYDLKLQIAGLLRPVERILVRGNPAEGRFAVFHLTEDRIQAVEAVNAPAEFMGGRNLIARQTPVSLERLADPDQSMKSVAA